MVRGWIGSRIYRAMFNTKSALYFPEWIALQMPEKLFEKQHVKDWYMNRSKSQCYIAWATKKRGTCALKLSKYGSRIGGTFDKEICIKKSCYSFNYTYSTLKCNSMMTIQMYYDTVQDVKWNQYSSKMHFRHACAWKEELYPRICQ